MVSKHGKGKNLLIVYNESIKYRRRHPDPTFSPEWSYCDSRKRLQLCGKGNYVFFHTTRRKKRYVTAYFVVEESILGRDVPRYNLTGGASHAYRFAEHYVILGDKELSKELSEPIEFDRSLAQELTFEPPKPIEFGKVNKFGRPLSDLECISIATRSIRVLTDQDVDNLLIMVK